MVSYDEEERRGLFSHATPGQSKPTAVSSVAGELQLPPDPGCWPGQTSVSISHAFRGNRIDAEFLADMANFFGSAIRGSVIISRSAVRPASVKNSRGNRPQVSSRMRPRASNPFAVGGSFGLLRDPRARS